MAAQAVVMINRKRRSDDGHHNSSGGGNAGGHHGSSANQAALVNTINQSSPSDARRFRVNLAKAGHLRDSFKNGKVFDLSDEEGRRQHAASRIQLFARAHCIPSYGKRLHRENLYKRLQYEGTLAFGAWRLFIQVMVFAFLLIAVGMSGDPGIKRGIYQNLADSFDFGSLNGLSDRSVFINEKVPMISAKAKDFFILSSGYFVPEGGSVSLVSSAKTFPVPKLLSGMELNIQLPEFSFTTLIKTNPQFVSGYILRKRILPAGEGSDLACWGWYITATGGSQLHFGAQDFFETGTPGRQEVVAPDIQRPHAHSEFALLTVVVSNLNVSFYHNIELVGTAQMPRPITDCFNSLEGLLVGENGMTLGQLNFHPNALTLSSIEEIYIGGSTLDYLSTGSRPASSDNAGIDELSKSMETSVSVVEKSVQNVQPQAEVNLVIQRAETTILAGATPITRAPSHPVGRIPFNNTLTSDTVNTGLSYYQLLGGPWRMDEAPVANDATFAGERFWHSDDFPRFTNRGVTFTSWFRNVPCNPGASCGTFLLSAHQNKLSSARCFSAWFETNGIYWDTLGGNPDYGYPLNSALNASYTDKFKVTSNHWRHMAWVFNEDTDNLEFYLDGLLAHTAYWGKSVKSMDCGPVNVSIGFRYPDRTYGADAEFYDVRMYVGSPMTPAQILALSDAVVPTSPSFGENDRCLQLTSPKMVDQTWLDTYGHGCEWYFNNKEQYPSLCQYPGVGDNCPIACKSKQECFNVHSFKSYFSWKSIRRIEAKTDNGTICLGNDHFANETVAECERWMPNINTDTKIWEWKTDLDERQQGMPRVNLTVCQELSQSIDPFCSFDQKAVDDFTAEMVANGGDFTLGFWIKPLGSESLTKDGTFKPSVHFLSKLNPPQANLAFGPFTSGSNGEARMRSACTGQPGPDVVDTEEIEIFPAKLNQWTFLAISKSNKGRLTGSARASVATNIGKFTESQGSWDMCLYNPKSLFTAIEINYPALISPIMMIPQELPFSSVQELYYRESKKMGVRDGPIVTNSKREEADVPIEKVDYVPKSVLMATPIIFQKRVMPSATCPYNYSSTFIKKQHKKVIDYCVKPFKCSDHVLNKPEATLSCTGDLVTEQSYSGLQPIEFKGTGFADFLFSITDQDYIFRDGHIQSTSSFVDSLTRSLDIVLVFFTPEFGLTTVMSVTAEMSGAQSCDVSVTVQHFAILEGLQLTLYVVVQSLVLVFVVAMSIDVSKTIRKMASEYLEDKIWPNHTKILFLTIDLITVTTTTAVVCLRLPAKIAGEANISKILGDLNDIPWSSSTVTVDEKKKTFFENVQGIVKLIEEEESVDSFLNVTLLILLIRVIQCTELHPRLALLTGTISKAMDDFWHSAILIILIMCSFAGIGTWRFGSERQEFGTFEKSMQTEFMMMLGEFLLDWTDDTDLQAFVVLYLMIMFLLVLNFLLAIIVEAYMGVRTINEENEVEMEFFTDIFGVFQSNYLGRRNHWPDPEVLGNILEGMKSRFNISFMDLYNTEMFRDQKSVVQFVRYYSSFDFVEPVEIGTFGKVDENMQLIVEFEKRIAALLDKKPTKLKDLATQEGAKSKNHRLSLASGAESSSNVLLGAQSEANGLVGRMRYNSGEATGSSRSMRLAGVKSDLGPYTPNDPATDIEVLLSTMESSSPEGRQGRQEKLATMGSVSPELGVDTAVDVPLPSQPIVDHSESQNADKSALAPAVLEN